MDKKVFTIILSVAAVLTAFSILLFSAVGLLPGFTPPPRSDESEAASDTLIPEIKEDYIPDEILPQNDEENGNDASTKATPGDSDFLAEPVPAGALRKDDLSLWNLIIVNEDRPLSRDFTVDLVEIKGGYLIDQRIDEALEAMLRDASADGASLIVCSAFRTVKSQKALIEKKAQSLMVSGLDADIAYSKANLYIAKPGESEHHTGLSVDFLTKGVTTLNESFAKTDAYKWLTDNAYRYGFILRYPKDKEDITHMAFEPWHYRFVGREHAAAIKNAGLCLEEYLAAAH